MEQKTEDRRRITEDRGQKTDGGEQVPEVGMGTAECGRRNRVDGRQNFVQLCLVTRGENNMDSLKREETAETGRKIGYRRGKIYFSAQWERQVFFILTMVMLLLGLLGKAGLY